MNNTKRHITYLVIILFLGIASRLLSTGIEFFDKYVGDALYAAMFFMIIMLLYKRMSPYKAALLSFLIVFSMELFQLTNIPLNMRQQDNIFLKILSILLGTEFNILDIASYIIGIAIFLSIEIYIRSRPKITT